MAPRVGRRAQSTKLHLWLWLFALVFFGIGDAATTGLGLSIEGVAEISPTVGPHIQQTGLEALIVIKSVLLVGGFLLWRGIPRPYAVAIPLGLALVGTLVTGWNISVLVVASTV